MANSEILKAAIDWAKKGVPVFPCGPDKAPLTVNGHLDASTDPEQVKFMFEGMDDCMIGARMGVDSGLFALDFDLYKPGAREYMEYLDGKDLLSSSQVHTTQSGGIHILYRGDGQFPNVKPHEGVEVKGEGGYIIVPPSAGYKIQERGIAYASPQLVAELLAKRKQSSASSIDQLKQAVLSGKSFHDPLAQIAARRSAQGWPVERVVKELRDLLTASSASSTRHARHERWASLVDDTSGELLRIASTSNEKFNPNAHTEKVKEHVNDEHINDYAKASQGLFSRPATEQEDQGQDDKVVPDWGTSVWPFEDAGYFSLTERNIFDQKYVAYPLFAERESVLIAAEPKAGKTAIALKLAMQVAMGEDLGEDFKVSEARPVLYFSLEGARAVEMRIRAELDDRKDRGLDTPERDMLFVVDRPHSFGSSDVRDSNGAKIVLHNEMCKREFDTELGLIVIDTLTKAMPGKDQNSVEDTSELFELIGFLRSHGVNATIAFIHHLSKQGNVRGSTNIEAEVDVVLGVNKDKRSGLVYMDVRRARSMDEEIGYAFEFKSHYLGETAQGHKLHAPIVRLADGHDTAASAGVTAAMAAKFAKVMDALVKLGAGTHDVSVVAQTLKSVASIPLPDRKRIDYKAKAIQEALVAAFGNQTNIAYGDWIVRVNKDANHRIDGVTLLSAS